MAAKKRKPPKRMQRKRHDNVEQHSIHAPLNAPDRPAADSILAAIMQRNAEERTVRQALEWEKRSAALGAALSVMQQVEGPASLDDRVRVLISTAQRIELAIENDWNEKLADDEPEREHDDTTA